MLNKFLNETLYILKYTIPYNVSIFRRYAKMHLTWHPSQKIYSATFFVRVSCGIRWKKKINLLRISLFRKVKHVFYEYEDSIISAKRWCCNVKREREFSLSEFCHWRRPSSPAHIARKRPTWRAREEKLTKKKKRSRNAKALCRAPEQISVSCPIATICSTMFSFSRAIFSRNATCDIDSRQRVDREASGARVFIDDTFRPERFRLSLFWQVGLRASRAPTRHSPPDHQSG